MELKNPKIAGFGGSAFFFGWAAYDWGLFGRLVKGVRRMIEATGDAQTIASLGDNVFPAILMLTGLACLGWGFGVFETLADWRRPGPRRISLIELRDAAIGHGWDFTSGRSLHPLDFAQGLRQAASDKIITFWGKKDRNDFDSLTRQELLVEIPPEHFVNYAIEILQIFSITVGGKCRRIIQSPERTGCTTR